MDEFTLAASARIRIVLGEDGQLHVVTPQLTLHLDRAQCEELTTTLARGLVRLHRLRAERARPRLHLVEPLAAAQEPPTSSD